MRLRFKVIALVCLWIASSVSVGAQLVATRETRLVWTHTHDSLTTVLGSTYKIYIDQQPGVVLTDVTCIQETSVVVRCRTSKWPDMPYGDHSIAVTQTNPALIESPPSVSIAVTFVPPETTDLPDPWVELTIGPGLTGSASLTAGTWTVRGSGSVYGNTDGLHYAYQPVTGSNEIIARVDNCTSTLNAAEQCGVMVRTSLDAYSANMYCFASELDHAIAQWRLTNNGSTASAESGVAHLWYKISVASDIATCSFSDNGTTWTALGGPRAMPIVGTYYMGLASNSNSNDNLATGTYTNVAVNALTPPPSQTDLSLLQRTQAGNTASASTLSTAATNHVAGQFLLAFVVWGTSATAFTSIADTAGNNWTQVGTEITSANGNKIRVYSTWNNLGHASNVVTATWAANTAYRNLDVYQFAGVLASSNPYIETKTASGNSTSITSGTLDAISGDNHKGLVVGLILNAGQSVTMSGGYTKNQYAITGDASQYYTTAYHFATADEAMAGTQATGVWEIFTVAFKDSYWTTPPTPPTSTCSADTGGYRSCYQGNAAASVGGRGGTIIKVTTLADTGAGSLRAAVAARAGCVNTPSTCARIVVFEVSGRIQMDSGDLYITSPYLTIAGQTAPPPGITVSHRAVRIDNTHDIIIQHMRFRLGNVYHPGSIPPGVTDDGTQSATMYISNGVAANTNVVLDHVSVSWCTATCMTIYANGVGMYDSIISEGLNCCVQNHGQAAIFLGVQYQAQITFSRNLMAQMSHRQPWISPGFWFTGFNNLTFNSTNSDTIYYGFVNLVGNGYPTSGGGGDTVAAFRVLWISNVAIAGPQTSSLTKTIKIDLNATTQVPAGYRIYLADNSGPYMTGLDLNGQWAGVKFLTTEGAGNGGGTRADVELTAANIPTTAPWHVSYNYNILPNASVESYVEAHAGARPLERLNAGTRDADDYRVIQGVINRNGQRIVSQDEVGGYKLSSTVPTATQTYTIPTNPHSPGSCGTTALGVVRTIIECDLETKARAVE